MADERKPRILEFGSSDSPADRKPKVLDFGKTAENSGDQEKRPRILHFEQGPPAESSPRTPTRLEIPDVVQVIPETLRTPKVLNFLFIEPPTSARKERKATILNLPNAEVRRRLEVNDGDISELFPTISEEVRVLAKRKVLSANVDKGFTRTCTNWGIEEQMRLVENARLVSLLETSLLLAEARRDMYFVQDFFLSFNTRLKERPESLFGLLTNKPRRTDRERFNELLEELNAKIQVLQGRIPDFMKLLEKISEASTRLSESHREVEVMKVAGELIEFRTLLGQVKPASTEFVDADREMLKQRVESLAESLSQISGLRDQLKTLYLEVAQMQSAIQNVLLVEVPNWHKQALATGFDTNGQIVDHDNWSFADRLKQQLNFRSK